LGELLGVKLGPYSDVYAFGKTCSYALFKTTEPRSRHLDALPGQLRKLLEGCIEHELEHRHASFDPVLQMLETFDAGSMAKVGDRAKSERDSERAVPQPATVVSEPKDAAAYFKRGSAYRAKEDYDRAIMDYTEAIRLDPNSASAYNNRGLAYQDK